MDRSSWKGQRLSAVGFLSVLLAQTNDIPVRPAWTWELLLWDIIRVVIYGFMGLAIFAVCYLIIDKLTPFSFGRELLENRNTAVAIVLAGVFLGIALILAAAIHG